MYIGQQFPFLTNSWFYLILFIFTTFCFRYMPIGIYFLMIGHVLETEDWKSVIKVGKLIVVLFLGYVHCVCFSFGAKLTIAPEILNSN